MGEKNDRAESYLCSGFRSGAWKWRRLLLRLESLPFVKEWQIILRKMLSYIKIATERYVLPRVASIARNAELIGRNTT